MRPRGLEPRYLPAATTVCFLCKKRKWFRRYRGKPCFGVRGVHGKSALKWGARGASLRLTWSSLLQTFILISPGPDEEGRVSP